MFTSNFYKLISSRQFSNNPGTYTAVDGASITNAAYYSGNGSSEALITCVKNPRATTTNANMKAAGVYFGNGTATPSLGDHKLAGDVFSTGTIAHVINYTNGEHGHTMTIVYTITNAGTADFTISEIGAVQGAYNGTSIKGYILIDRTVLDTPVTIPAGGVGQVTYTIRMNYPTA